MAASGFNLGLEKAISISNGVDILGLIDIHDLSNGVFEIMMRRSAIALANDMAMHNGILTADFGHDGLSFLEGAELYFSGSGAGQSPVLVNFDSVDPNWQPHEFPNWNPCLYPQPSGLGERKFSIMDKRNHHLFKAGETFRTMLRDGDDTNSGPGEIEIILKGELIIRDDCSWSFEGTVSALNNDFDFRVFSLNPRPFKAEAITTFIAWTQFIHKGQDFEVEFQGQRKVKASGYCRGVSSKRLSSTESILNNSQRNSVLLSENETNPFR